MLLRQLLLCSIFFLTFAAKGQSKRTYQDLLFNQEIQFQEGESKLAFEHIQKKSVRVTYPKIILQDSTIAQKLNKTTKAISESILDRKKSYTLFNEFFQESIQTEVKVQSDGGFIDESVKLHVDGFKPILTHINFTILSLCKSTLIISYDVHFRAINESIGEKFVDPMIYSELRYVDISTGNEINKFEIIHPDKQLQFHQLLNARIPPRFSSQVSNEEIIRASPFINGAAVYFVLQGSTDDWGFDSGLPPIQIRFELANIQEFINPNGPFAPLLTIDPNPHESRGRKQHEYYGSMSFNAVKEIFKPHPALHQLNGKVRESKMFYHKQEETYLYAKFIYDDLGRVIRQMNYNSKELRDSVVFEYIDDSNLFQHVRTYPVADGEEGDYYLWAFDELGNLRYQADGYAEDGSYYETWMEEAYLFTYLGDYAFEEEYSKSEYAMACIPGVTRLEFKGSNLIESNRYNWSNTTKTKYEYNKKDQLALSYKLKGKDTTYFQSWEYDGKKLVRLNNLNKRDSYYSFTYDRQGNPLTMTAYSPGVEPRLSYTMEYDSKGLPLKRTDYRLVNYNRGPEIYYTYEYSYR